MWNVTGYDWNAPPAAVIERKVTKQIRGGDVILLHDGGHKQMGADRSQTVLATEHLIAALQAGRLRIRDNLRDDAEGNAVRLTFSLCRSCRAPQRFVRGRRSLIPYRRKCLLRRRNRPLNIFLGVRRAQKRGLILRRRQINSCVEHRAEEFPKRFRIRLRCRIPIRHRPVLEEPRKHRSHAVVAQRQRLHPSPPQPRLPPALRSAFPAADKSRPCDRAVASASRIPRPSPADSPTAFPPGTSARAAQPDP